MSTPDDAAPIQSGTTSLIDKTANAFGAVKNAAIGGANWLARGYNWLGLGNAVQNAVQAVPQFGQDTGITNAITTIPGKTYTAITGRSVDVNSNIAVTDTKNGRINLLQPIVNGESINLSDATVLPHIAASNTTSSSGQSTTTTRTTVNVAEVSNDVINKYLSAKRAAIESVDNMLNGVLNAPEDIFAVYLSCYYTFVAANLILRTIETRSDLQLQAVNGNADVGVNPSTNREYMDLRAQLSNLLDDLLRSCRFRMRRDWLNPAAGVIDWNKWPGRNMSADAYPQNVEATQKFLASYMDACSTNSLANVAQRKTGDPRDAVREYYAMFLSRWVQTASSSSPNNGIDTLLSSYANTDKYDVQIFGNVGSPLYLASDSLGNGLVQQIIKTPAYQHANRIMYIADGLPFISTDATDQQERTRQLIAQFDDLITIITGAMLDYTNLPKFADRTTFSPFLFFRKLVTTATVFMTPSELLAIPHFWVCLYLIKSQLNVELKGLVDDAITSRNSLVNMYSVYKSDPAAVDLAQNEKVLWSFVYSITNLIGNTTQINNGLLGLTWIGDYMVEAAPPVYVGNKMVTRTPLDVNTVPMASLVFKTLFKYDTSTWQPTRLAIEIPAGPRAASLFLQRYYTYLFDPRDYVRWRLLGYQQRMLIPQHLEQFPMDILRVEGNTAVYEEYLDEFTTQQARDRKVAAHLEDLRQRMLAKSLDVAARAELARQLIQDALSSSISIAVNA